MNINELDGIVSNVEEPAHQNLLKDIIAFVKDIKPVLESINQSVNDNINKMPDATDKLNKVTQATENATNEIMNVVDGLFEKTADIQTNLSQINTDDAGKTLIAKSDEVCNAITEDATNIMMALQVQDITAQQINAVNSLLETIQSRLQGILNQYNLSDISEIIRTDGEVDVQGLEKLHNKVAFDPDAVSAYFDKDTRQTMVDDVIGQTSAEEKTEELSDDDIAKMFGG